MYLFKYSSHSIKSGFSAPLIIIIIIFFILLLLLLLLLLWWLFFSYSFPSSYLPQLRVGPLCYNMTRAGAHEQQQQQQQKRGYLLTEQPALLTEPAADGTTGF